MGGIDPASSAVELSQANAEHIGVSDRYRCVAATASDAKVSPADVLVSNPPYIPTCHMAHLEPEVLHYEDANALCGGEDGLDVARDILRRLPELLRRSRSASAWFELDVSHLVGDVNNCVFAAAVLQETNGAAVLENIIHDVFG